MDVGVLGGVRQGSVGDDAQTLRVAFRDGDAPVPVRLFDDGDMPIR